MKARKSAAPDWLPDIALVPPDLLTIDEAAQEDLRQTLLQQKLPHLRAIAAARGITGRGGQRETLVPALVESLLDPAAQEAVVGALDQPARAVLALARGHGRQRRAGWRAAHAGRPGPRAAGARGHQPQRPLLPVSGGRGSPPAPAAARGARLYR